MKRAFLILLFLVSHAFAGDPMRTVGAILDVNGTIASINELKGTITVAGIGYSIDVMSSITVDGKRGSIHDLAAGMTVTGSAQVTTASGDFGYPEMAYVVKNLVATTSAAAPPNSAPGTQIPGAAGNLKQQLAGTFWKLTPEAGRAPGMNRGSPPQTSEDWFSLNADGTATCSWLQSPVTWAVDFNMHVVLFLPVNGMRFPVRVQLDPDFIGGKIFLMPTPVNSQPAPQGWFKLARIPSPTAEMLAKVQVKPSPSAAPGIAAAATPASTPTAETQDAAAEVIKNYHSDLVFVTGKEGAGSGFIASLNGSNFLVTNAHVAAGINNAEFKTLDGTVMKGDAASVAIGEDVFCMALASNSDKPFQIMQGVDANTKIGDDVVVLGNAEGSGVVHPIIGKIVGIGPNLVEVDAPFVPGNSGSPIVHLKTGKVIGVATYTVTRKYDVTTHEKLARPEVRRYGYRLDSVKSWQAVNWPSFYSQAAAMEKVHTLTVDLGDFLDDIAEHDGRVTDGRHTNPVIKDRIAEWIESKGGRSESDKINADANFLSFLKIACQSDVNALQGRLSYDYFQRELSDEQQDRAEMAKAFSSIIEDIQKH